MNISASSDRRKVKHSSLEPSRQEESNGGRFIFLPSLDAEIFIETVNGAVT
jgi:hypothetical protein